MNIWERSRLANSQAILPINIMRKCNKLDQSLQEIWYMAPKILLNYKGERFFHRVNMRNKSRIIKGIIK